MSALVALLVGVAWGVGPVVAFEDELGGDEPILHGVLADGAVGAPELPVEPLPSDEVAIVGGNEVAPGDWDEVVLVISNEGLCTGTVIGPRVVLTAAPWPRPARSARSTSAPRRRGTSRPRRRRSSWGRPPPR